MSWWFGSYPEPWRSGLRASFILFVVVFVAGFSTGADDDAVNLVLISIFIGQLAAVWYVRKRLGKG